MSQFLLNKIRDFKSIRFVRNVATLQIGNFLGNFIQALFGIFIARALQPESFGTYSLAMGMASLASIILGAGIQDAVANIISSAHARNDAAEIKDALAFMLKMTGIIILIAVLLMPFLPYISERLYNNFNIGIYAIIIVIASIFSMSFFSLVTIALQVVGKIKTMMALSVVDQLARYGLSLTLIIMGLGVVGASGGHLIGAAIIFMISVFIWRHTVKEHKILPALMVLLKRARTVGLKKYFGFSFWVAMDRNMGNLFMALPVVLTGIYVVSSEVTFFKLAFGFVNLALSMLGPVSVLLNMEFPKMLVEDGRKLAKNFVRVSLYSMGLSILLVLGAIIVAPFVFKFLYGVNFMPSVKYISGLFIYGALFGIGVGLGPMWRAIGQVKISIIINLIILGLGIPLGLWLIKSYGLWGAVIMVTLWFSISHLTSFFYLLRKLRMNSFSR